MAFPENPEPGSAANPAIDKELTFFVLTSVARRKLLVALADGKQKTAADLMHHGKANGLCSRRSHFLGSTTKHLSEMVKAGIVLSKPNPDDGRKTLYWLSPAVKVSQNGDETTFHFGICIARLFPDGN